MSNKTLKTHSRISTHKTAGRDVDAPGAPGAAAPSSPGGSGSRTPDSSSTSASSASPPPSAARPSEVHPGARRTLSPGGRRQASHTGDAKPNKPEDVQHARLKVICELPVTFDPRILIS